MSIQNKYKNNTILFLGVSLYVLSESIANLCYSRPSFEWFNLVLMLNSISYFVLSVNLFWYARRYKKAVLRWFMVYCLLDVHTRIISKSVNFDLVDSNFILQIVVICLFEFYLIYRQTSGIDK